MASRLIYVRDETHELAKGVSQLLGQPVAAVVHEAVQRYTVSVLDELSLRVQQVSSKKTQQVQNLAETMERVQSAPAPRVGKEKLVEAPESVEARQRLREVLHTDERGPSRPGRPKMRQAEGGEVGVSTGGTTAANATDTVDVSNFAFFSSADYVWTGDEPAEEVWKQMRRLAGRVKMLTRLVEGSGTDTEQGREYAARLEKCVEELGVLEIAAERRGI